MLATNPSKSFSDVVGIFVVGIAAAMARLVLVSVIPIIDPVKVLNEKQRLTGTEGLSPLLYAF